MNNAGVYSKNNWKLILDVNLGGLAIGMYLCSKQIILHMLVPRHYACHGENGSLSRWANISDSVHCILAIWQPQQC